MFLNFGRFFGFGFQSKMDTLLKQDNLTLETILNEEDILAELKNSSSGKFADFIISHPIEYKKMIDYITNDITDQQSDKNTCIKYPFYISEILGSENEKLINFLFEKQGDTSQEEIQNPLDDHPTESQPQDFQNENEQLRNKLLPDLLFLLENDSILITSAGYFAKIISAIIHKRGFDFWDYLKQNPETISNLFKHIGIRHITEIFEKLIILDTCQEEHDERLYIQERQQLIARLLKYLNGQSHSNTIITNICETFIEIYKRALMSLDGMIVLRELLLSVEKPQFFMNLAIKTQNSAVYNLLNIQYEFNLKMSQLEDKHYEIDFSTFYKPILDASTAALTQQDIFKGSFQTTYGAIIKPLGDSKLSLLQLIIQLISKQELAIIIEKGQIFQQVINLVIAYSTNNQLHILFHKMVETIVDSKNDHLHELFFQDTNFLDFLINNNGSEERAKKHGYKGILTKITNYINSTYQQHQIIQSAILNSENKWKNYMEQLKPINDIEQSWLLGVNPRFRGEQINVDSYSPPLQWPEQLGSEYKSINNPSSETNENQQESKEDNSNHNQNEEIQQQADQFDSEVAQIEKQEAMEGDDVPVKEENIEQEEESQPQNHELQIVDSPIYVEAVQIELENEQIPEQTLEIKQEQQIQQEQVEQLQEKVEQQQQQQQQQQEQEQEEAQELQQQEKLGQEEQIQEPQNILQEQPKLEQQQNQEQIQVEQQEIQSKIEANESQEQLKQNNEPPHEA
ncbi:unnamed protein product [Paramecium sonneborni]|uniref:Uncharacterized protein n=1 Tax=Paramecium sonneborni TaxID=65129 RepID=A0A8S1L326_9CILI|nr:unnamed protein product [Paramecium sonneborni]